MHRQSGAMWTRKTGACVFTSLSWRGHCGRVLLSEKDPFLFACLWQRTRMEVSLRHTNIHKRRGRAHKWVGLSRVFVASVLVDVTLTCCSTVLLRIIKNEKLALMSCSNQTQQDRFPAASLSSLEAKMQIIANQDIFRAWFTNTVLQRKSSFAV